jgi:hypothetical protein
MATNETIHQESSTDTQTAFWLNPYTVGIVAGIIGGLVVFGAQKLTEQSLKSGELMRAMSGSAQKALENKAREINELVRQARQENSMGFALTTPSVTRTLIAAKYEEAARIIKDDLHNITLNDSRMKPIAVDAVEALGVRADRIRNYNAEIPAFYPENLHSSNTTDSPTSTSLNTLLDKMTVEDRGAVSKLTDAYNLARAGNAPLQAAAALSDIAVIASRYASAKNVSVGFSKLAYEVLGGGAMISSTDLQNRDFAAVTVSPTDLTRQAPVSSLPIGNASIQQAQR